MPGSAGTAIHGSGMGGRQIDAPPKKGVHCFEDGPYSGSWSDEDVPF